jgi:hypothetical protein
MKHAIVLAGDEVLPDGSVIHWDDRDPDNPHRARVMCGGCGQSRYVYAYTIRQQGRGLCRRCSGLKGVPRRENSVHWKGGRQREGAYIRVRVDTLPGAVQELAKVMADKHGTVYEHRIVAACKIGRPLLPNEVVHHINGVKDDNRPGNLEVSLRGDHLARHVELWNELRRLRRILEEHDIEY